MQQAVPYRMGYHPPPPWRIEAFCQCDGVFDLHLLQHFERPRPHLQPQMVGHAFHIHLTVQTQLPLNLSRSALRLCNLCLSLFLVWPCLYTCSYRRKRR